MPGALTLDPGNQQAGPLTGAPMDNGVYYGSDGTPQPPQGNYYNPYGVPYSGLNPYLGLGYGALAMMAGKPPPGEEQDLAQSGQELLGKAGTPDSPLSQLQNAEASKRAAINQAYETIANSYHPDKAAAMEQLAMAAGMAHAPGTASIGEAFGAGYQGALGEIQRQQELERNLAATEANLDLARGNLPGETTQQRLSWGERMDQAAAADAAREYAAQLGLTGRIGTAGIHSSAQVESAGDRANAEITRAQILQNQHNYEFAQPDPDDPTKGIWMDRRTGTPIVGPLQTGKNAPQPSKNITDAYELVKNGSAPDFLTAYGMVRSGMKSTDQFQTAVNNEAKILQNTQAGQNMTPEQLEANARQIVIQRAQTNPLSPVGSQRDRAQAQAMQDYNYYAAQDVQNGGKGVVYNSDGSVADRQRWVTNRANQYVSGAMQIPGAATANRRTEAPAAVMAPPTRASNTPPRPDGVPASAGYSASQGKWWWRDQTQPSGWNHN